MILGGSSTPKIIENTYKFRIKKSELCILPGIWSHFTKIEKKIVKWVILEGEIP